MDVQMAIAMYMVGLSIILGVILSGVGYLLRLRRTRMGKLKQNFHKSLYKSVGTEQKK